LRRGPVDRTPLLPDGATPDAVFDAAFTISNSAQILSQSTQLVWRGSA
jgi:hypothetical protein